MKKKITLVIPLTYILGSVKMSIVNTSNGEKPKLNYSEKEKAVFFNEVEKYKNIIDLRSRKPADMQAKNKSWEAITDAYNAHKFIANFPEKHRTMEQLRKLYNNENYQTKKHGNKKDYFIDGSVDNKEIISSDEKNISHEQSRQKLANIKLKEVDDAAIMRSMTPPTSALPTSVTQSVSLSTTHPDSKPSTPNQEAHVSLKEKKNSETLLKGGLKVIMKRKSESSKSSNVVDDTEKNDDDLRQRQEKKLKLDILLLRKRFWTAKALREELELELRYKEIERKEAADAAKRKKQNNL